MEIAIKVVATIALAFTLITLGLATIMSRNSVETKSATRSVMTFCALAQILGIIVIWMGI